MTRPKAYVTSSAFVAVLLTASAAIADDVFVAGHNQFSLVEIGVWRTLGGLLAYGLARGGHAPLFGVSPLSW